MFAHYSTPPHTCGLTVLYDFSRQNQGINLSLKRLPGVRGTGFFVCGFIHTKTCESFYKEVVSRYKLVYQSPVRTNTRSGNRFFFCVFDVRAEK